jgi:hypothetical protein
MSTNVPPDLRGQGFRHPQPWPCPTRQEQLLAEYGASRVSLSLYLSSCLVEASHDLPHDQAGAHYFRFLGWCDMTSHRASGSAAKDSSP